MDIFDEWRSGGTEIHWRSTTAANAKADVTVFTRRCGTPGAPALVCVHGFPTASIDFVSLTRELDADYVGGDGDVEPRGAERVPQLPGEPAIERARWI